MARPSAVFALLLAALLLAGCNKLTAANYARLETGMSKAQVTALLGPPASCQDFVGITNCTWGDKKSGVNASFINDGLFLHDAHNLR
ncbi:MAG: outer membrane protein assembly factor BamE [Betaproteobacteria bacterium]